MYRAISCLLCVPSSPRPALGGRGQPCAARGQSWWPRGPVRSPQLVARNPALPVEDEWFSATERPVRVPYGTQSGAAHCQLVVEVAGRAARARGASQKRAPRRGRPSSSMQAPEGGVEAARSDEFTAFPVSCALRSQCAGSTLISAKTSMMSASGRTWSLSSEDACR